MKYLKDLKEGEKIIEFYLVDEKQIRTKKNGEEYISFNLKDKTGYIPSVIWDNVSKYKDKFQKGDFVKIEGLVGMYGNGLQITIRKIRKVEERDEREGFDKLNYFETTERDTETMWKELLDIVDSLEDKYIQKLVKEITKENEKKIKMYPGAMRIHHEYIGGFLEHTLSVARTCDYFSGKYGEVNRDLLIAGAILHDIGKLKELSVSNITEYSEEGNLIGHIVLGSDMVKEKARKIEDFPEDKLIQLDHIILSHQGNMEWGSPKPPMTIEALILHYAEDLDAKVNIFKRAIKKDREEGKFTQKDPLLGRVLYKG